MNDDERAARIRTAWESEHVDDPLDLADSDALAATIPGDWEAVAREYQRLARYWRDAYLDVVVATRDRVIRDARKDPST